MKLDATQKEDLCWAKVPCEMNVTIWRGASSLPRAVLLYYHGGGLVCGRRDDLPAPHLEALCAAGFAVAAFDYRLAPAAKLPEILADVNRSVLWFLENREQIFGSALPYFLWGRSAGAYLCLLAARSLPERPLGLLSYYGYAFLERFWYNRPAPAYLRLPRVEAHVAEAAAEQHVVSASLEERFPLYIYGRQTGNWPALFFDGREKELLRDFSYRAGDFSACPPVFLAHSFHDPDVPFGEARALADLLQGRLFAVSSPLHDFDRESGGAAVRDLLRETVDFLEQRMAAWAQTPSVLPAGG